MKGWCSVSVFSSQPGEFALGLASFPTYPQSALMHFILYQARYLWAHRVELISFKKTSASLVSLERVCLVSA
jgi:hypothetical protein